MALARLFVELAQGPVQENAALNINDRPFRVRRVCAQAAWFDFASLCDGPYGSADYIELARTYPAILISGLPQFTPFNEDAADRKSTRLNSSHPSISYAVFCLKKKTKKQQKIKY